MAGWTEFVAALVVFFLSHMIPVRPPVRPWLVARLGERGFLLGYSLLSVAILIWLIVAAGRAPYVEVIPPLDALRWAPFLAMPVACWLAVAGLSAVNPLSFGGLGQGAFDPQRPGILAFTRHPLLLALLLWAVAHLLANGDLAHVILFGLLALFSGAGMALIDRRKRRVVGKQAWSRAAAGTALVSLSGLTRGAVRVWQVVLAALVFVVLLMLHPPVIGMSALPWF